MRSAVRSRRAEDPQVNGDVVAPVDRVQVSAHEGTPYWRQTTIFEGIGSHATDNNYQAVSASTDHGPEERCRQLRLFGRRIDGLVIGDAHLTDAP